MVTEFPVVVDAEVRQLMVLPVRPQVLDRVQFRSVGRKELQPQPPALLPYEVPDHSAAVTAQAIPDDQQLASQMAQQVAEELDHLRAANRAGIEAKIEIPPGHASHGRQRLPVKVILQPRRLSAWCPGPAAVRPLAQAVANCDAHNPTT